MRKGVVEMKKRNKRFGDYVFESRRRKRVSQEELGLRIGVNASTISRIESGSRKKHGYELVLKLRKELEIEEPEDGFIF